MPAIRRRHATQRISPERKYGGRCLHGEHHITSVSLCQAPFLFWISLCCTRAVAIRNGTASTKYKVNGPGHTKNATRATIKPTHSTIRVLVYLVMLLPPDSTSSTAPQQSRTYKRKQARRPANRTFDTPMRTERSQQRLPLLPEAVVVATRLPKP